MWSHFTVDGSVNKKHILTLDIEEVSRQYERLSGFVWSGPYIHVCTSVFVCICVGTYKPPEVLNLTIPHYYYLND